MVPKVVSVLDDSLNGNQFISSIRFQNAKYENCQLRTTRREIKDREDETLILVYKVASTLSKSLSTCHRIV